ncbi:MAG: hypothetical protein M0018_04375 [Nitrospiraceae bacterium]|nr:hypothetical protein [Nitrospiraceae bacterium]
MQKVLDLKQFLPLGTGETYYKGYLIPGRPNWARIMISKLDASGLVVSVNYVVFMNSSGALLWEKFILQKVQPIAVFEKELEEFRELVEKAGLLFFLEEYGG